MSATHLIVVRHVETTWNAERRTQGQLDSPPTKVGVEQARALAARFAAEEEKFTELYSSDLGRARFTAEQIGRAIKYEVLLEKGLRERHFGIFGGLTDEECREKFPVEFESWQKDLVNYPIPGGESWHEFYRRAAQCFEELVKREAGKRIVVVTHGGVLDSLFRHVFEVPLGRRRHAKLWNASINVFTFNTGVWQLNSWGDRYHLRSIGAIDDSTVP
jgi:probable phosphoglycerate mutase